MPELDPIITQYTVSALPEGHINYHLFSVTVDRLPQRDGSVMWAVRRMRYCLTADGSWDWEHTPSGRTDEWLASHRHDLETALRLAREAAAHITVNGLSVDDVLARTARRQSETSTTKETTHE